ncbi:DUF2437 domain-containing protein [Acinetobacter sp. ANC 5414]|uniref:DUF2437 domain-containing protein n=1 Tax=Acinetobacter sp. ANC 5414 TaxID=2731251 RepID=UPI001BE3ED55|nr:DUF2437 domain-containing protein [Acinetobacter sp. ANC 5414]
MKLARFSLDNEISFGLIKDQGLIDFSNINIPYKSLQEIIESGKEALEIIDQLCVENQYIMICHRLPY